MRVWLCGVRGSTPAPGHEFAGVGGHTSCVALAHDGQPPSLVLDAGTGLRRLTDVLAGEPFRGTLLLGHLHWDHTAGIPFFRAGDRGDAVVRVLQPQQGHDARDLLARGMSPPLFPIAPEQLRGRWTFDAIDDGDHCLEGFRVLARDVPHKGGRTFGFRITDGSGASLAYISDHDPLELGAGSTGLGAIHPAALELAGDVDLLLHDAQYTAAELDTCRAFGHSAAGYGPFLAAAAGARRVLLYHHEPSRSDAQVAAIANDLAARHPGVVVDIAKEGMVIDL